MTEDEWRQTNDVYQMIEFVWRQASDRKMRLFSVACVRRVWKYLGPKRARNAVETSEKYADRLVKRKELKAAYEATTGMSHAEIAAGWCAKLGRSTGPHLAAEFASLASSRLIGPVELRRRDRIDPPFSDRICEHAAREKELQADLLRDIFGNPFRPSTIDPAWLTWNNRTVPKLAQTIYDDRRYDIMPILADALEEAGCTDAQILDHCRGPGPHVRGCWVVDLILGKE